MLSSQTDVVAAMNVTFWHSSNAFQKYRKLSDLLLESDDGEGRIDGEEFQEILASLGLLDGLHQEDLNSLMDTVSCGPFEGRTFMVDYREFLQKMAETSGSAVIDSESTSDAPELVRKLLWHSRQMDVEDSSTIKPTVRPVSGMSDTYRHFNKSVHRPPPSRSQIVDITTFFDAQCYKKPLSTGRTVTTSKPGSLAVLFDFYGRITSSRKKLNNNKPSFAEIQRGYCTITFCEMIILLRDFDVIPRLLSKHELQQVWQTRSREEDNPYYRELTYNEFVDCLARCALLAFPKLGHSGGKYNNEYKVKAFISFLGLDSMNFLRKKLRTVGRETAGQINFGLSSGTNSQLKYDRNTARIAKKMHEADSLSLLSSYDASLTKLFAPYRKQRLAEQWRCYDAPFIDMGTVLRNKLYRFKVELCNRSSYILQVKTALRDCYGVRILGSNRGPLAPGLTHTVEIEANFSKYRPTVNEKHGTLLVEISSLRNSLIDRELVRVPVYFNLVNPSSVSASNEGASLEHHEQNGIRPASAPARFSKVASSAGSTKLLLSRVPRMNSTRRRPHTAHSYVVEQKFL